MSKKRKKKKQSVLKEVLSTSIYLLSILVVSLLLVRYVAQRTVIIGSSMVDTLYNNDNVIVEKISYRFSEPQRFDIIVFPYKHEKKTNYVKRIIGLPGETIYIDFDGNIFINDVLLEENYGTEIIKDPGIAIVPITLGEDEYFVLGDNRNHSKDSRVSEVGTVNKKDIIGRAWVLIWPFSDARVL